MGFLSRLFRSNTPAVSSTAPSAVLQSSTTVSTPNTELSAAQAALALDDFSAAQFGKKMLITYATLIAIAAGVLLTILTKQLQSF